jgi:hypothetical protein
MNDPASHQPAPHDPLKVLRGQFPGWEAWRGIRPCRPAADDEPAGRVPGYTAKSLAEQIRAHEARQR